jgi:hypothetical protein
MGSDAGGHSSVMDELSAVEARLARVTQSLQAHRAR